MTISINPNRLRNAPTTGKSPERKSELAPLPPKPAKAHVNYIPSPEALRTLIASAVTALSRGVRWDRGTILNLLA